MVGPGVIGSVGFEATIGASAMSACSSRTSIGHREFRVELPSAHQLFQFLHCEFLLGRWLILAVLGL